MLEVAPWPRALRPRALRPRAQGRVAQGRVAETGKGGTRATELTADDADLTDGKQQESNPIPSIHGFRTAILKNRAFVLSPVLSVYPIRVISVIRG
jgi:hypothetical protein